MKRREHDQRLRLQAKSANVLQSNGKLSDKSRRPKGSSATVTAADGQMPVEGSESVGKTSKFINDEDRKPATMSKPSRKTPLPLLLPEEILAAQPVVHAPKSSFPNSKAGMSQKRKFLDLESKPPKDIKRGDVTICVLLDDRSILPRKSCQLSRDLREYWLTGRRGLKGEIAVPRRKLSAGFLRRK